MLYSRALGPLGCAEYLPFTTTRLHSMGPFGPMECSGVVLFKALETETARDRIVAAATAREYNMLYSLAVCPLGPFGFVEYFTLRHSATLLLVLPRILELACPGPADPGGPRGALKKAEAYNVARA